MSKLQCLTDASFERETYSAPSYERFTFETSGLTLLSENKSVGQPDDDESDEEDVGW